MTHEAASHAESARRFDGPIPVKRVVPEPLLIPVDHPEREPQGSPLDPGCEED